MDLPQQITLDQWDDRYEELCRAGLCEPEYGGTLRRHVDDGDRFLLKVRLDNSPAALRLWNFLLTEEDRLRQAREDGLLSADAEKRARKALARRADSLSEKCLAQGTKLFKAPARRFTAPIEPAWRAWRTNPKIRIDLPVLSRREMKWQK